MDLKKLLVLANQPFGQVFRPFKVQAKFKSTAVQKPKQEIVKPAISHRRELKNAKRLVIKLGSSVITRGNNFGLALGRLASIVEQIAEFQNHGKECMIVTSGSVAFGRQKVNERNMPQQQGNGLPLDSRAAASVGQPSLMYLYDAMFSRFNVQTAQILVTETDIYIDENRKVLMATLSNLLKMKIVPIVNTNDCVTSQPNLSCNLCKTGISLEDNDSLAAVLAAELQSDVLLLLSSVDGIYNKHPDESGAKLLNTFTSGQRKHIEFGKKSFIGKGGMDTKVQSSLWALDRGTSVIICNGSTPDSIRSVIAGKKLGTFFTHAAKAEEENTEIIAVKARKYGRLLQLVTPEQRATCINTLADLLASKEAQLLEENKKDLENGKKIGLHKVLLGRLTLTQVKLNNLAVGLRQIAESSRKILGRVIRRTQLADGLELRQITVPIGVLLVIFESRPDVLPQIAALAIASGNGLVLKGGEEAVHSNKIMMEVVKEALKPLGCPDAIGLVSTREEIADLINMDEYIDLIIPRGSNRLVRFIQEQAKHIPVMGHSEGICHVFVDKEADHKKALKIIRDAKCDYPSACNAMETLLIHNDLMEGEFFSEITFMLKNEGVKIHSGPRLNKLLAFGPPLAKTMKHEYGALECAVEVVSDIDEAVAHIHANGSGHTEVIITENKERAEEFLKKIDAACAFHNASSRMADGFRFGLGAEVGISTARIHARGPVGVEGLLTTKWVLRGVDHTAADFTEEGGRKWVHKSLPLNEKESKKEC